MFVVGMDIDSRAYFGSLTLFIGLPTCIKLFNWFWCFCFFFCHFIIIEIFWLFFFCLMFLFGGLTGLLIANVGLDILMHDTYFVIAHFHYVLSLGAVVGFVVGFFAFFGPLIAHRIFCFFFVGLNVGGVMVF